MSQVMLALDVSELDRPLKSVLRRLVFYGLIDYIKVGLEIVYSQKESGYPLLFSVLVYLSQLGIPVMIDSKLPDKPGTNEAAARNIVRLKGVRFFTVMANSGKESLQAARRPTLGTECNPVVVTVLTSMDGSECKEIYGAWPKEKVVQMVRKARNVGYRATVCSPQEVIDLRQKRLLSGNRKMFTLTPGIRPAWAERGDQRRFMTPTQAVKARVDVQIIGVPILDAKDPVQAARLIREEISAAIKNKTA